MPRLRGLIAVAAAAAAAAADFFVDCVHGSDSGSGSAASPFLTPNRARDAVRALQPLSASATVHLLPGSCYPRNAAGGIDFTQPVLTLNNATVDSAPAGTTITWIAEGGPGSVLFMGGLVLDPQYWTPSAGKPGVFQYDLGATGYDFATFGFGSLASGGLGQCVNNQAELFFNSQVSGAAGQRCSVVEAGVDLPAVMSCCAPCYVVAPCSLRRWPGGRTSTPPLATSTG